MELRMFAVYDSKAQLHIQPFFLRSDAEAVRAFGDLINDPGHPFGRHPEDYTLMFVGSFDEEKGVVISKIKPEPVAVGVHVREEPMAFPMAGGM